MYITGTYLHSREGLDYSSSERSQIVSDCQITVKKQMQTIEAHSERFENAMTINEFICVILLNIEKETPATYS